MAAISVNINIPKKDFSFVKQLAKRMGWVYSEVVPDSMYNPETGQYLNEETMQAIRDVEAGKVTRCKNLDEILADL